MSYKPLIELDDPSIIELVATGRQSTALVNLTDGNPVDERAAITIDQDTNPMDYSYPVAGCRVLVKIRGKVGTKRVKATAAALLLSRAAMVSVQSESNKAAYYSSDIPGLLGE